MRRPSFAQAVRGQQEAARVDAVLRRLAGPPDADEAFTASMALWALRPGAFARPRTARELADEARVRELFARLRRPHVR
ncbi:MAG TPA: hypothetical protein VHB21_19445 [Minicystis sp.]|nr:hypothetical protein [Minicystis sp.]